jgi:hypothetical protein
MRNTKTARTYKPETLTEKISWFFTHFLYVSNEKVFKIELDA